MTPLSPSQTRALLAELGHRPIKKLGQNFLIDGNIARKSLKLAEVQPEDRIVEIGPGLGTLTQALLAAGVRVFAVEKDPRLAAHLQSLQLAHRDRLSLLHGDAMDHPLADCPLDGRPFKIVANLPYAISSPWMEAVLSQPQLPVSMTLMLQKEAAARYVAQPGGKQFGAITIFLQAAYTAAAKHDVSAACFFPRPDVDSRLLCLRLRPDPFLFDAASKKLIRELFQQRRKQLATLLRKSPSPLAPAWLARLPQLAVPPATRPEQIPTPTWTRLASAYRGSEAQAFFPSP